MSSNQDLSLSLVITSYTTERLNDIYELLESIKIQTLKNMETIFVVERSEELRDKIIFFIAMKSIPAIKVVFSTERLGLSAARNLGIKHSKGNIISFVDDDVVLFPDWAEEMVKSFEDDTVIGVTGSVFPLWESESLKWLPEQFYWLISCTAWTGLQKKQTIRGVLGANMAFRNGAFTNGALFSTNAGYTDAHHYNPVSDDLEFSLRIRQETGRTIMYSLGPKVWHRVNKKRLCWRYVTAKSQEVGRCRRILKKQYARELGKFEQERLVLHGLLNTFIHVPKKLFTQPFLALKELILILVVLISVGIGYILPLPMYSPIRGNVPN